MDNMLTAHVGQMDMKQAVQLYWLLPIRKIEIVLRKTNQSL